MNQNNIIKSLVPVLAVIVLAESVVLISRFNNKVVPVTAPVVVNTETTSAPSEVKNKIYSLEITSDKPTYKVGEQGTVTVKMTGNVDKSLDAIDLYVKYDPSMITASGLTFDKLLPAPSFNKVSTLKKLLVANFLISSPAGVSLKANETVNLMTFKIKAIKAGINDFEISTGNETNESATMIVENGTSKPLAFSGNKLSIKVTE